MSVCVSLPFPVSNTVSIPHDDLMADLRALNASIMQERITVAMSAFKADYSYRSFYGSGNTNCTHESLIKSDPMLASILRKYSLTRGNLYDRMLDIENLKAAGVSGTFSLFELRNHLFRLMQTQHISNMHRILRDIERCRKPATVCNSGCTQCDAPLPLWWPSARAHSREERNPWWDRTMGFYRIGFCSSNCISAFNDSLRSDCRIEEPEDGIMSAKTRYTCQHRACKREILWTDLERRGWITFCCESCEEREHDERYEDDQMYAQYDRYLDEC